MDAHMNKKHRKINITVISLLSVLLFAGCANVEMPSPTVSEKTTSELMNEILSALPEVESEEIGEVEGQSLTVFTPEETVILGDEQQAGSVRNAIRNRNELIASAYGMEVTAVAVPKEDISETLKAAVQSGVAAGDLLCYSAETSAMLWANGLLADLSALPYFDVSLACTNADAAQTLAVGDALYLLPHPSAQSSDEMYVLFYDRTLVQNTGLARPETAVNAGNWTVELFQSYAESVAQGVMNKTSYDLATDVFGYSSPDNTVLLPYLLWCGQGKTLFTADENGSVRFAYDADTLAEAIASVELLYDSRSRYPLDGEDAYTAFAEGRLGFLVAKLEYLKELYATSGRSYGILPLPKASGNDGYTCPVSVSGNVFSAPILVSSTAKSGLGLTALCAAGGTLVRAAEKETYVALYAVDNDQSCMLETVLDAQTFDFGAVFGTQESRISDLAETLISNVLADGSRISSILTKRIQKFDEYAAENLAPIA